MEVISLDNISLWRRTQEEFSYDIKTTILALLEGKHRQPVKKKTLDNISLVIEAGEKVGIIGANGSGKSTLMKIICQILKPTTGKVRVRGQIAPLIELGAGFVSDLSVIDNIVFCGILLGFSRQEMKNRLNSILQFAELEEYAYVPVKALSSGMKSRLGFAIATDVQPDILILDEVFSVGDAKFKKKCNHRMEKLWDKSGTILMVSHDLNHIKSACERVIWLEKGQLKFSGDPQEAIEFYLTYADAKEEPKDNLNNNGKMVANQTL
ncbi:MAG: ABC transporter ATP-binding protein [Oscillatoria sp. PMC 1076.18]|nr:ABC transporter ATP-binding protein [Oscillatoria sp. PMC 1076.18]